MEGDDVSDAQFAHVWGKDWEVDMVPEDWDDVADGEIELPGIRRRVMAESAERA